MLGDLLRILLRSRGKLFCFHFLPLQEEEQQHQVMECFRVRLIRLPRIVSIHISDILTIYDIREMLISIERAMPLPAALR